MRGPTTYTLDGGPLLREPNTEVLDVEALRSTPIVPRTINDLLVEPQNLPILKVGQSTYTSVSEYLATHFSLLHEAFWGIIREGIIALQQSGRNQNAMQVYTNVKLEDVSFTEKGTTYNVTFSWNKDFLTLEQKSKCLKYGSLVCISDDSFKSLLWTTVINFNHKESSARRYALGLRCIGDPLDESTHLQYGKVYTMAESTSAFFEAFAHSLRNLLRVEMAALPFAEHLISLVAAVAPPSYIASRKAGSLYSLRCVSPNGSLTTLRRPINIMEEWHEFDSLFDASQKDAIKHGLTKRLAIIQGPPGTGKTFVGLALAQILLTNLWTPAVMEANRRSPIASHVMARTMADTSDVSGPIVIVCCTNYALDQFLEGIYEFERQLVRLGRQSKSSALESCLISNLRNDMKAQAHRPEQVVRWQEEQEHTRKLSKLQVDLQNTKRMLELKWISSKEHLSLVAQEEQVKNLFLVGDGGSSQDIVQMWLQGHFSPVVEGSGVLEQDAENAEEQNGEAIADKLCQLDLDPDDTLTLDKILNEPYPWTLSKSCRHILHQHWLELLKALAKERVHQITINYENLCNHKGLPYDEVDLEILQKARVVGMTASAAARSWELLVALKPDIMIVEEAAEVLEAHIIACLTPYTKHLILIGDHKQLRPSVSNYRLSVEHNLDVSMFERLVTGQVEHKTLNVQHRMRPSISRLVRRFYPELLDHESVTMFESVRGLRKDVFFWDHQNLEVQTRSTTKTNEEEADMAVALALYLTQIQGYKSSEVAILTLYAGQRDEIKRKLGISPEAVNNTAIQVTSVDEFQGKQSNIIILSLVRSDTLGYAGSPNRICVALSRARKGLYILGNATLFRAERSVWKSIIADLSSAGNIGTGLPLSCPNHPVVSDRSATCAADIGASRCILPCKFVFPCGHLCPQPCHYMGDHINGGSTCNETCYVVHPFCNHFCSRRCSKHDPPGCCPPCENFLPLILFPCHHQILVPCYQYKAGIRVFKCPHPCRMKFLCGHSCPKDCGEPCMFPCMEMCTKELPCGHSAVVSCSQPVESISCWVKVSMQMPCGHFAKVNCGNRETARCNKKVMRTLPCGHNQKVLCGLRQQQFFSIRCHWKVDANLPCGHKVTTTCRQLTSGLDEPCSYPCSHKLPCGHNCSGTCASCHGGQHVTKCNQPCAIPLPCFHKCQAPCGAPCKPCGLNKSCLHRCVHTCCSLDCSQPCPPCSSPCPWKCEHFTCNLPCNEVCTRPRCHMPCLRILKCGHPCIGMCGEPCPTKCRICHANAPELFTRQRIGKLPASTHFVQLVDCGHICEVGKLDSYMDGPEPHKNCPRCRFPISERNLRYGSIVKALHAQAQERKGELLQLQQSNQIQL